MSHNFNQAKWSDRENFLHQHFRLLKDDGGERRLEIGLGFIFWVTFLRHSKQIFPTHFRIPNFFCIIIFNTNFLNQLDYTN